MPSRLAESFRPFERWRALLPGFRATRRLSFGGKLLRICFLSRSSAVATPTMRALKSVASSTRFSWLCTAQPCHDHTLGCNPGLRMQPSEEHQGEAHPAHSKMRKLTKFACRCLCSVVISQEQGVAIAETRTGILEISERGPHRVEFRQPHSI